MAAAFDAKLEKLFTKHAVDDKIRVYLLSKNIVSMGQFAGLADSKPDVAEGICVPGGLDPQNRTACQPVKTAWQEAEAYVTAELEQIRKGKFTDLDDPIDPEVRIKKDTSFNNHYHIRLPPHLTGCDTLAGRCVREHERKTPTAPNIMKVKSLAHKADEKDKGANEDGERPLTRFKFMYKHRVLMNTMAFAVAPEWDDADWSSLLDYHEWMVLKLYEEKKGHLPPLAAVVEADFQMRIKWVESMRNDRKTLTEAIKLCRIESVSLYSDLHEPATQSNQPTKRHGGDTAQESPQKRARREVPRIDKDPKTGKGICAFYNIGKCSFGTRCKASHMCNVKGCGDTHMASDNHGS